MDNRYARPLTESRVVRQCLLRASRLGARLFRNNVGRLKVGERWVQYGLCVGSSDLIGWMPVTVTPEMVGTTVAVFVAIEAKTISGALRPEQRAFLQATRDAGAIAEVVRSVADLEMALAPWVRGEQANQG